MYRATARHDLTYDDFVAGSSDSTYLGQACTRPIAVRKAFIKSDGSNLARLPTRGEVKDKEEKARHEARRHVKFLMTDESRVITITGYLLVR